MAWHILGIIHPDLEDGILRLNDHDSFVILNLLIILNTFYLNEKRILGTFFF
jgi:hypothetical protein